MKSVNSEIKIPMVWEIRVSVERLKSRTNSTKEQIRELDAGAARLPPGGGWFG